MVFYLNKLKFNVVFYFDYLCLLYDNKRIEYVLIMHHTIISW